MILIDGFTKLVLNNDKFEICYTDGLGKQYNFTSLEDVDRKTQLIFSSKTIKTSSQAINDFFYDNRIFKVIDLFNINLQQDLFFVFKKMFDFLDLANNFTKETNNNQSLNICFQSSKSVQESYEENKELNSALFNDYPNLIELKRFFKKEELTSDLFSYKNWIVKDGVVESHQQHIPFLFEKKSYFNLFKTLPTHIIKELVFNNFSINNNNAKVENKLVLFIEVLDYLKPFFQGKDFQKLEELCEQGLLEDLKQHRNLARNNFDLKSTLISYLYFSMEETSLKNNFHFKEELKHLFRIFMNELFKCLLVSEENEPQIHLNNLNENVNENSNNIETRNVRNNTVNNENIGNVVNDKDNGNELNAFTLDEFFEIIKLKTDSFKQIVNTIFYVLNNKDNYDKKTLSLLSLDSLKRSNYLRLLDIFYSLKNQFDINSKQEVSSLTTINSKLFFNFECLMKEMIKLGDYVFFPLLTETDFEREGNYMGNCVHSRFKQFSENYKHKQKTFLFHVVRTKDDISLTKFSHQYLGEHFSLQIDLDIENHNKITLREIKKRHNRIVPLSEQEKILELLLTHFEQQTLLIKSF